RFKKIGILTDITSDLSVIEKADKLILPGVGHFAHAMENLHNLKMIDILNYKIMDEKIPILGICLGMQLLTKHSEEGNVEGLSYIDAETKKFVFNGESRKKYKIPHIGWNTLKISKINSLFNQVDESSFFYFVHSYYVDCYQKDDILALTNYGREFVSAFHHENIYGTQFHPEKSHSWGTTIIKNYIHL
ncbi:imidazole glycerol phosphate synthase subunit HisH, partial [Bacteroidota bacterium]